MKLDTAIEQSPDNTSSNFGSRGWITVEQQTDGRYLILTEDNPHSPRYYDDLEAVKRATRLFDSEAWEPYEEKFD